MEGVPVLRGPGDVYHDEAYLIGWLVKTHGWRVVAPGILRRTWQPERSVTAATGRLAPEAGTTDAVGA
jgi:hypothetical protein